MSTKWKLTAIEHVDEMQDKAHTQAQGKHVQASAGHTRTKGPCKPRITTGTPCVVHLHDKQHCEACEAGARHWGVLVKDMQWKRPGKGTYRVASAVACLHVTTVSAAALVGHHAC